MSKLTDEQIKEIMLANGFKIKEGQDDLMPYVYAAARAIEDAVTPKWQSILSYYRTNHDN